MFFLQPNRYRHNMVESPRAGGSHPTFNRARSPTSGKLIHGQVTILTRVVKPFVAGLATFKPDMWLLGIDRFYHDLLANRALNIINLIKVLA